MRQSSYVFLLMSFLLFDTTDRLDQPEPLNIIPRPLFQKIKKGNFALDKNIRFISDAELSEISAFCKHSMEEVLQFNFTGVKDVKNIIFKIENAIENEEGYELSVKKNHIRIRAKNSKGAFYAVQSLLQLIPVRPNSNLVKIPCVEIRDQPQFSYRGVHLDVGRHCYSVGFIKKYIDLISRVKMNTFHWHLTEDQGWRIEIKKYPKLQEIAAYRNETLMGHYNDQPHQFDGKRYGGFYSQEEIKEIVAYAKSRQVTIIPEIEMPGHSRAAIAAYPELGCTGKAVAVATKWGIFEEVYCTKEPTFRFLEGVIDEVVALFPGNYIHIGGDEAPKTNWKKCAHCQKRIKKYGLKNEQGLQSYFIKRIERYINSKGKQLIGWDEILEGGLAPNATVMSWRGTQGAVEAAKKGHDVVLTPNSHCYFDYYQSDHDQEPLAIGGFLPLEKVYAFNPIPKGLDKEESKRVLGAQGNVWTEYMPSQKQVEYMAFPRIQALSEVVWSSSENKQFTDFVRRLEVYQKRLDVLDVNYATHLYEVKGSLNDTLGNLNYELSASATGYPIHYTINNKQPSVLYTKPIAIDSSMSIKAFILDSNKNILGNAFYQKINVHKGVGATLTIDKEPHPAYGMGGKRALINGISGNIRRYGDREWLGFSGEDLIIKIEFDKQIELTSIKLRFFHAPGQWIYEPKEVRVYTRPENDKNNGLTDMNLDAKQEAISLIEAKYHQGNCVDYKYRYDEDTVKFLDTRSIRIQVKNYGVIPEGKQGAGHKAWTFIDEIIIE